MTLLHFSEAAAAKKTNNGTRKADITMATILVVDDSKTNLTLAKQTLEPEYHVMPVLSGEQALRFLEKKHPDIILLDLNMPEMDGIETMRRIKANPDYVSIPIIILTATSEPQTEIECIELGAVDFITKPFVPQVMRLRISRILELEEYRKGLR